MLYHRRLKNGHVRFLFDAIKRLRNPTDDERMIKKMGQQITELREDNFEAGNREEYKFWNDLIQACLQPVIGAFSLKAILKDKLQNLRNKWLLISGIVNCLWIVIIMTLSRSLLLKVAGTDPLSLIFLVIFGLIFVLQFFCMLIHRFHTLCHFLVRAPYRFQKSTVP